MVTWSVYDQGRGSPKDLLLTLAVVLPFGFLAFIHPGLALFMLGGMPVLVPVFLHWRRDNLSIVNAVLGEDALVLRRATGREVTIPLADVAQLRPVLVGYRGGESTPTPVLEITTARGRRYRTSDRYTPTGDIRAFQKRLETACPHARLAPYKDRTRYVTPD